VGPRPLAHPTPGSGRRVSAPWVVRLPTWLGDTVMALPTIRAIARHTDAPLVLWGRPVFRELLAFTELRFDYLPYRRRRGVGGISDAVRACGDLRARGAQAAVLLPNAFEPALLTRAAGIPRRIGYGTDGRARLLSDAVPEPLPRHTVHETDRFAYLAEHIGAAVDATGDQLIVPNAELEERAAQVLPAGGQYLGIAAGSANTPAKRWAPTGFAELIGRAHREWDAEAVLLGSEADRPINDEIGARVDTPTLDLSGSGLADLMAALLRCRVVVSNDSGAAHLAAALGRPTVVLFGPTDPQRTLPRGPRVVPLSAGSFCAPCNYGDCPLDNRCMHDLTAAMVLEKCAPFWQRHA